MAMSPSDNAAQAHDVADSYGNTVAAPTYDDATAEPEVTGVFKHIAKVIPYFRNPRHVLVFKLDSYGLREAPQGVGRGGHDGKKTAMKAAASKKRKQGAGDSARESLFDADTDLAEMERRMKMKMKTVMNSASEFNIG
ncbi:hypothetical protein BN1723_016942 [Verticillium longisporum]|uniref:Uncharacterized protein n=1 Tax=Verticillium longisporum TaxID=100787 RepID=A0A0G4NQQ7_VERLO|nr:hypothetical protein BN1723_016942 [Verticillium longisporum]